MRFPHGDRNLENIGTQQSGRKEKYLDVLDVTCAGIESSYHIVADFF
jgi:hypothetical protein